MRIDLTQIVAGNNDRKRFDLAKLRELADSIAAHGLIQPITVRQMDIDTEDSWYEIVAGERRFRAVQLLGWESIEANVIDLTDEEASAVMLAENVAREDLNPVEEALAYQSRIDLYNWDVAQIASRAGVSTVRVKFRLKLLSLRPEILDLVRTGNLALGYAQVLSDADLDTNFQMLALRTLRDNRKPTPAWFRKVCNELRGKQNQVALFDLPLMGGAMPAPAIKAAPEPPTPATHQPAILGSTPRERVESQISFWEQAAVAWDELGKPFKRQECTAAAKALQMALAGL